MNDKNNFEDNDVKESLNSTQLNTEAPKNEAFTESDFEEDDFSEDDLTYESPEPTPKETKYVTKRFFIITLIIAMIVASVVPLLIYNTLVKIGMPGTSQQISATNYTLAKSTGSQLSVEEIIAKNATSVVEIRTESVSTDSWLNNYVKEGAGSGVIIDSDGYIVTNNHVIENAGKIVVKLKNGKEFGAVLVGTDPQTDVAVLKISASGLQAAQYGDSSKLSVGQLTVIIGNPLGQLGGTATTGILSALDREVEIGGISFTLLQTDASINPGNSGGGMFDGNGNMIGLVVAKSKGSDVEGLGFAIPINKVAPIVKDIIANGKVTGRPVVGIKIFDVTKKEDSPQSGYDGPGVYIKEVVSKEAKKAGLQEGDKVFAVEGEELKSASQFISKIQNFKVGEKVKLTIVREGKTKDITVELGEGQ